MSQKITLKKVYQRYLIPENLKNHMQWAAALGLLITENWNEQSGAGRDRSRQLDQELIIETLLLHDLANLIKFEFDTPLDQLTAPNPKELKYWAQVQKQMVEKYGSDTNQASIEMIRELNLHQYQQIIKLLEAHSFEAIPALLKHNGSWEQKIVLYSDLRIMPGGIASIKERIADLKQRYQSQDHTWDDKQTFGQRLENSLALEEQLNACTKLDLPEITQNQLKPYIHQVSQYYFTVD